MTTAGNQLPVSLYLRAFLGSLTAIGHTKHPVIPVILIRATVTLALGYAAVHPRDEEIELPLGETTVVGKLTVSALRRPRRHPARQDFLFDRHCPWARFRVGPERHGHAILDVALEALTLEQGHIFPVDVTVVRIGVCDAASRGHHIAVNAAHATSRLEITRFTPVP